MSKTNKKKKTMSTIDFFGDNDIYFGFCHLLQTQNISSVESDHSLEFDFEIFHVLSSES